MDRPRPRRKLKVASPWGVGLAVMTFTGFLLIVGPTQAAGGSPETVTRDRDQVFIAPYGSGYEGRRFNRSTDDGCRPKTGLGRRAYGYPKQGSGSSDCGANTDPGSTLEARPGKPREVHKNLFNNPAEVSRPVFFNHQGVNDEDISS